ncbi:trigger factor, partial [Striga asiatica]
RPEPHASKAASAPGEETCPTKDKADVAEPDPQNVSSFGPWMQAQMGRRAGGRKNSRAKDVAPKQHGYPLLRAHKDRGKAKIGDTRDLMETGPGREKCSDGLEIPNPMGVTERNPKGMASPLRTAGNKQAGTISGHIEKGQMNSTGPRHVDARTEMVYLALKEKTHVVPATSGLDPTCHTAVRITDNQVALGGPIAHDPGDTIMVEGPHVLHQTSPGLEDVHEDTM